jgi:hypothetical protein
MKNELHNGHMANLNYPWPDWSGEDLAEGGRISVQVLISKYGSVLAMSSLGQKQC